MQFIFIAVDFDPNFNGWNMMWGTFVFKKVNLEPNFNWNVILTQNEWTSSQILMIRCEPTGAKVGGLSLALVKALSKDKKAKEKKTL